MEYYAAAVELYDLQSETANPYFWHFLNLKNSTCCKNLSNA